jgi:hypothetical protein
MTEEGECIMAKKKQCPNCYKKVDEYMIHCEFCGHDLTSKQTTQTKTTTTPSKDPFDAKTKVAKEKKPKEELKWYQRFFKWLWLEIRRYFTWCCCWGKRPEDLE